MLDLVTMVSICHLHMCVDLLLFSPMRSARRALLHSLKQAPPSLAPVHLLSPRPNDCAPSAVLNATSTPLVNKSMRLVMCTVCSGMIRGGNLRLGVPLAFRFRIKFDWMHPACYTDSRTRMQRPQGGTSDFNRCEVRANTCLRDVSWCFVVSRLHILYAFPPADSCCSTRSNWTNKFNKASSDR